MTEQIGRFLPPFHLCPTRSLKTGFQRNSVGLTLSGEEAWEANS